MPHVCGDEPAQAVKEAQERAICPTYVGMNRQQYPPPRCRGHMPHVCGDEPQGIHIDVENISICPTYVGMNRCD